MDEIRALLERLAELSTEELATLKGLVIEEVSRLDGEENSVELTAAMNDLADITDQVIAEETNRATALTEAEQGRAAAKDRIAKLTGKTEDEGDAEAETPAEEEAETPAGEGEAEADGEIAEDAAEEQVAVAAGGSVRRLAGRGRKPAASPERETPLDMRKAVLVASGALRVRDKDKPITDRYELAEGIAETLNHMSRTGPARGDVIVASAQVEWPEDRVIKDGDAMWENTRIMEASTGMAALTASNGTCLPVNVDYSVSTWATADRPLRDGLPSYQAPRGGVRFVQPPDIGEWEAATAVWTEATDANPEGAVKPVVSLKCGTEELVYTNAISTRLGFGNMQSRFAPEQVAANTDLAVAAAARVAENEILKLISEQAVKDVTSATLLGATRDLITVIDQVVAAYRQIHRLPDTQALTAIFPNWLKSLLKIDLAREIGHSQNAYFDALQISDEYVEDVLKAHGVTPLFHLDGQPESGGKYPSQVFAQQLLEEAVKKFPEKMVWYFFAEGQVQFLDAGRLDLGVVRDSTLDATNDYETFVETFEGIANRGFANGILQLVSKLCANGGTAGTISTAGECA